MVRLLFFFLLCLFLIPVMNGQVSVPRPGITTGSEINHPLRYPWAGGVNACQLCPVDLDLDGTDDLLVFDRHGNRKLTFRRIFSNGFPEYEQDQSLASSLPVLHDWVITADYDLDGKKDLFTYGNAGVRIFRNVSDSILRFRLVTDMLQSFYYNGYIGILVTSVDYPAIADIDGDGDLDLLTFFGLGSFVEFHQNMSMERYGHCDSLDFRLADPCWGRFRESESGNKITLNVSCQDDPSPGNKPVRPRHTGSTLRVTDLNGDELPDLILGDYDFPNLIALYNGGTKDTAKMVSMDTLFPGGSSPVQLFSFPAVSMADIDADGLDDLVTSPFDPALYTSDNYNCIWYYRNTGTARQPQYEYTSDRLFRGEMVDFGTSSHPVIHDFDSDGLPDLFVGNEGYYDTSYYTQGMLKSVYTSRISWFRNTGSPTEPKLTNITDDFANLSGRYLRGLYPAFSDVNGDGLTDLVTGSSDGTLTLLLQKPSDGHLPQFHLPVDHWQGIDAGDNSAPFFFDFDGDGAEDLIIGEKGGNLNYYRKTGAGDQTVYQWVTDSLGKINVTDPELSWYGYSTPCLVRSDDGSTCLVVGSESGRLFFYAHTGNDPERAFPPSDTLFQWLSPGTSDTAFGWNTSPAIGHLTDTLQFDMITGNFSGGLNYISKRTPASVIAAAQARALIPLPHAAIFPNPADQWIRLIFSKPDAGKINVRIYDIMGRQKRSLTADRDTVISVSDLPPGMYVLAGEYFTARFIIYRR